MLIYDPCRLNQRIFEVLLAYEVMQLLVGYNRAISPLGRPILHFFYLIEGLHPAASDPPVYPRLHVGHHAVHISQQKGFTGSRLGQLVTVQQGEDSFRFKESLRRQKQPSL